jgi:hypothetical protein
VPLAGGEDESRKQGQLCDDVQRPMVSAQNRLRTYKQLAGNNPYPKGHEPQAAAAQSLHEAETLKPSRDTGRGGGQ